MTLEERLEQAEANQKTAQEQVHNWTLSLARAEGTIETLKELIATQAPSGDEE